MHASVDRFQQLDGPQFGFDLSFDLGFDQHQRIGLNGQVVEFCEHLDELDRH